MDTRTIQLAPPLQRDVDVAAGGALDEPLFDDSVCTEAEQ
jgi:hypothetical protein